MTFKSSLYSLCMQSWWVIAFLFACMIFYEQGLKKRDALYQQLTHQLQTLQKEKEEALIHQKELQLQIKSQDDLAWIELTLMKKLGLIPEGMQKVYFYPIESEEAEPLKNRQVE